ncbi:MAG: mechanosensitive ion channel [Deltaproteobacteria bacterium]|jgi:small conductance mechanosensitive channel|nr:mechanosensitive ion channel [Deltaproteobacteria bacterium]MCW8893312.1 mechanosensitive ion channel [Deltaproteobacteria bacterium]
MGSISTDKFVDLIQSYGLPLVWAIIIFIVGRIVARIISNAVGKMMTKGKVDETLIKFAKNMIYIALMIFVVLAALGKLGIETTSFAAIIAAAGLAIGLSLSGTLGNFASGVMLILFRPFKVGDFVEAGGVSGVIEEIQIFSTKMKSGDNKEIIVPNGTIIGSTITNYSAKETRRVDLVIGVSYEDDLKKVRAVLEDILGADERILKDPAPTIGVLELGDSSVNFAVRPWVKSGDYWPVLFAVQETVKLRFDAEGISIPYPQQDVHFIKEEAAA